MPKVRMETYYETLCVSRTAKQEEIISQYEDLKGFWVSLLPKVPFEAETKLIELTRAFQVLNNPDNRKHYDESLDFDFVLLDGKTKDPEMEEAYSVYRATHGKTYIEILTEFSRFKEELGDTLWMLKTSTLYLLGILFVYTILTLSLSFLETWTRNYETFYQNTNRYLVPAFLVLGSAGFLLFRNFFLIPKAKQRKELRKKLN
ncbi:DnaJ domain-containing protein [Leptospira ilyithenensis]|uniref:Molecular chaperone DnaJ n=1 Tax=Leptospira ilyithenensis TaxID=2484901 RepID=A0A4R9LN28_9LEPT|nr:DnaJ domain-containing protein [Leptospira ilyithenensis]TGN08394.1 molecular chaperone DnaJ [Leptospira ilyithenensis]